MVYGHDLVWGNSIRYLWLPISLRTNGAVYDEGLENSASLNINFNLKIRVKVTSQLQFLGHIFIRLDAEDTLK